MGKQANCTGNVGGGVETAFDLLKSKLQLENFSGKTKIAIEQDFYASIFLASMANVLMNVSDDIIAKNAEGKSLKYKRKSNQNRTISKQRKSFFAIFLCPDPKKRRQLLDDLMIDISTRPEPIRHNLSASRGIIPRKLRFPIAKKAVLP